MHGVHSTRPSWTPLFFTAASTCGVIFTNPIRLGTFMVKVFGVGFHEVFPRSVKQL